MGVVEQSNLIFRPIQLCVLLGCFLLVSLLGTYAVEDLGLVHFVRAERILMLCQLFDQSVVVRLLF